MPGYREEQITAALLQLPIRSRARVTAKLLNSLRGDDEPDAGWIEELKWRLQDWRTGSCLESFDDFLDDPDAVLPDTHARPEKSFDAVRMMRDIREKISRAMEGMTSEEELAYINEGARRFREKTVENPS